MNRNQFLLMKLAEECNEVAKRALKQAQFGANEKQSTDGLYDPDKSSYLKPEAQQTNAERTTGELVDIAILCELLEEAKQLVPPPAPFDFDQIKATKISKMNKYLALSRAEGQIDGDWTI
jgi:hypothetical protein